MKNPTELNKNDPSSSLSDGGEARKLQYSLFMQAPACIALLKGPRHVFEFANPLYLQLVGNRDILGKTVEEALPEVKEQGFVALLDNVYQTGLPFTANERYLKLDRSGTGQLEEAYLNFVYQPYFDQAGKVEGIFVHAVDVTEQVKTRKVIEGHNKVLEMITTSAPLADALELLLRNIEKQSNQEVMGAVFLLDEEGTHARLAAAPSLPQEYVARIEEIAIGEEGGALGMAAYARKEIVIADIATDPLWKDSQAVHHGLRAYWSTPILSKNRVLGTLDLYYRMPYTPTEADKKGMEFAIRTATLIIERKHAEGALRTASNESEKRKRLYETITSNTPDLIYVFDLDYSFAYANEALLQMWGRTWYDSIGKRLLEVGYEPWHAEMHEREIDRIVVTKQPVRGTVSFPHATLGKRIYDYILVPVLNEQGTVEAVAGTTRDITDIKRAEESLAEKNKELLRINNDLDNFIYTASHDLKSPISNLEGLYNELVSEMEDNDTLAQLKEMIEESFERFKNTIKDLTEISKVQKEKEDDPEAVHLEEILEDVKASTYHQIVKYQPVIVTHFTVPIIEFSRKNLRSILYNLFSNALKYSSPTRKPRIEIATYSQEDFVVICVKDDGMGIASTGLHKIFQMFQRLHTHVEGTGVGLYIVKKIVENAGGRIEVESELDKGSTFKVFIPHVNG